MPVSLNYLHVLEIRSGTNKDNVIIVFASYSNIASDTLQLRADKLEVFSDFFIHNKSTLKRALKAGFNRGRKTLK